MWQAIMHHRRAPPVQAPGEFPATPADAHAAQVRAIKAAWWSLSSSPPA